MKSRFSQWQRSLTVCFCVVWVFGFVIAFTAPSRAGEADWSGVLGPTTALPQAIGSYARGCLDGAIGLALEGPGYQVMRPSRERQFGHPDLIDFVHWLGGEALAQGWPGILVGDLAQARGGPMRSGHASHQSGLDADVWFLPAPDRPLSRDERETLPAVPMVAHDGLTIGEEWTSGQADLLRAAALHPKVDRIFVNAAIKQELCRTAGRHRAWLSKIRPWWGHDHHFHVRMACPHGDTACTGQPSPPAGDGCGAELAWWFSEDARQTLADQKKGPRKVIGMRDLPPKCASVYQWSPAASAKGRASAVEATNSHPPASNWSSAMPSE